MKDIDKLIKKVLEARSKDLQNVPVRLNPKYKHFIGGTSQLEKDLRNAKKINRNAPVKVTKIKPAKGKK